MSTAVCRVSSATSQPESSPLDNTKNKTIRKTIRSVKNQIEKEPSIVPIAIGIGSIFGAFLGCLWNTTRFVSPLLGTFGTILLLFGAHTAGDTPLKSIMIK